MRETRCCSFRADQCGILTSILGTTRAAATVDPLGATIPQPGLRRRWPARPPRRLAGLAMSESPRQVRDAVRGCLRPVLDAAGVERVVDRIDLIGVVRRQIVEAPRQPERVRSVDDGAVRG